jgi:protein SCO1
VTPRHDRPASRAAVATALAAVTLLAGCGSTGSSSPPSSGVGTSLDQAVPSAILDLPLRRSDGSATTLGAFSGRTVVISDSMTLCSEDCPLDTANVVTAARAADAAGLTGKVVFLTITVDPHRDTPRRLTAYRRLYDPDHRLSNWLLLTASRTDITRLWQYFGVYWRKVPEKRPPDHDWLTGRPLTYDIEHADVVLMLDANGHERYLISGHAHVGSAGNVPTKVRDFLNGAGRRHLYRPGSATWTWNDVLQGVHRVAGDG